MSVDDAVKATWFLRTRVNVPMHDETFDLSRVDPAEFVRKPEVPGGRAIYVRPGSTLEIP